MPRVAIERTLLRKLGYRGVENVIAVAPGREMYVYEVGTTDEADVYDAATGGSVRTQPLTANDDGQFTDCFIYQPGRYDFYTPHDGQTVTRSVDQPEDIRFYGARGDGTTSDQAALVAAHAAAYASGAELYFPEGTYLSTATIPNFHDVRKRGPGVVKRGSDLFAIEPKDGDTNRIYTSDTGTSDGLSSSQPASLPDAVEALAIYPQPLMGTWEIHLAAGTAYPGVSLPTGLQSRDYVYFKGPTVAVNVEPTAVIDEAAATNTAEDGILAADGQLLAVENIKTTGFTAGSGVEVGRGGRAQLINHWDTGSFRGRYFFNGSRYFCKGGELTDNTGFGILELFNVVRSHSFAGSSANGLTISGATIAGIRAKESCSGHLDFTTIEDCPVGLELQAWSTANVDDVTIQRCTTGVKLLNSEIHDDAGGRLTFGTGADANTRNIARHGFSIAQGAFGGQDDAVRVGLSPPLLIAYRHSTASITGTTDEQILSLDENKTVLAGYLRSEGQRAIWEVWGRVGSGGALAAAARINFRIGNALLAGFVDIPSGASASAGFVARAEMLVTSEGDTQTVMTDLRVNGSTPATPRIAFQTNDLSVDRDLKIGVDLGNSGDTVRIDAARIFLG